MGARKAMSERMTAAELRASRQARRQDREGPIHRSIIQLLELCLPPDAVYHHSPNELDMAGPEAARQIAKARKLGTRAGWPDIEILHARRAYFLEVKADGGQSEAQKAVERDLWRAGASYAVVRSAAEAEAVLKSWGLI